MKEEVRNDVRMKYALPESRKIPIRQNRCVRPENHVGNTRIQAVSNGTGFVLLRFRFAI